MKEKKEEYFDCSDFHYHSLKEFESIKSLDLPETTVVLRVLKHHLDTVMEFETTDELFIDIVTKVPYLRPLHPFGAGGRPLLGYIQPLKSILKKHGVSEYDYLKLMSFFCLPRLRSSKHIYEKLLLHIPHSSTIFPEESDVYFDDLYEEERLLIDYYTNELFVPQQESKNIMNVVFPYCRLYCDVERLINDPLEKDGLGISYYRWVPCKDGYGKSLRSFSEKTAAFALYADFHAEVSKKIVEMGEGTLLVDCHSFSSLPNLLNSNPPDIDICIGYNDDETCPNKVTIGNIVQYFKARGYKVGINEPFSNSKTFSVPVKYHSVMIEVNKKLYMDEQTLEKAEGFERLKQDIQALYTDVLLLR